MEIDTHLSTCALYPGSLSARKQQAKQRQLELLQRQKYQQQRRKPDPFEAVRVLPSKTFHLYAGSRFQGKQRSGSHSYDVVVDIKHVDLGDSFLCGYLHIKGLTEEYPELTTYFEAEIIGPKHSFFTRKWDADELVDEEHWTLFRPFECLSSSVFYGRDKHVDKGEGRSSKCTHRHHYDSQTYDHRSEDVVFMRWKEHFLVPDHQVQGISGASFAGFYYICYSKLTGHISGFYYHHSSEKYVAPLLMSLYVHDASPYHDVENVRMIASPLFKVPSPISPPYDMHPLPEDVIQRRYHDFSLEHRIVQEYQRIMAEEAAAIEARESAYKLYNEERQARLKQERITMARKIAPGFLDNDDRRILTPTLATAQVKEQTSSTAQANTSKYAANRFDYSEFEARDSADEGPSHRAKEDGSADNGQSSPQGEGQREESASPIQDGAEGESNDGSEEEVIVQAVPLSELTGMLRDSCLEEESSSSTPRNWHDPNPASEKSTMPSFNATRLDFREFEQGLGPPDPWDTPVDDLTALKDVISQQMGHTSSTMQQDNAMSSSRPQHMQSQQSQHALSQSAYPYQHQHQHQQQQHHQTPSQQYHQPTDHSIHGQYPYSAANTPSRTNYNSSPIPVASFVPPTKLTGIAQQQAALQHHQQQHRHSTGGIGAHPTTGLAPNQQHARFGNASPSPPPVPPPPRAMTTSPSVHSSTTTVTPGGPTSGANNRPRLPARPLRQGELSSTDSPTSAGLDHVTVMDRSMTPPRPPLPPPPHPPTQGTSSTVGSGGVGGSAGGGAAPPALKPRPPKDHEMLHGILGPNQKTVPTGVHGGLSEVDSRIGQDMDDSQQQQQVAPAPPQAESLISQLASMGFTREQSRSALEKYDYDLEKATNHLLDWDE
ncbi:GID complex subunit 4, VID24 [Mortierella sp. GBA35]|nr:GID complex subunit 4, VID24 [Mortierella sp. GBA35]